jgi:antitoxin HigA-1
MARMFNPPHPGKVLREYLGTFTVTDAAARLGITRTALSRILNGNAGISAHMSLRLEAALGVSAQMWLGIQADYELWQASQHSHFHIEPFHTQGLSLTN